jgi:hypothetical protein
LDQKRSYTQHLTALTIAEILGDEQNRNSLFVFAQDLYYYATSTSYITSASPFNFTALDDPEGFGALDEHTCVSSFATNVPVRQAVMRLAHDFAGPAEMMCYNIHSDGLECNGKGGGT